jgi:hypothetical protein
VTEICVGVQSGLVFASTVDSNGNSSNTACYSIVV